MEEFLRSELGIEDLKCLGKGGSGCISEGMTYQSDKGEKLFIKFNNKPGVYKYIILFCEINPLLDL